MDETWRPVVGLEGSYEVSDWGRIRGLDRFDRMGRHIHAKVLVNARMGSTNRYVRIRLRANNQTLDRPVHHMVLEAFVGPRPAGADACHNDGDRWNNRLDNLRWDTRSANQRDKIGHGTIARGRRNGFVSLTEARVRFIKRMLVLGVGPTTLARAFGTARVHVQHIGKGRVWGWLPAGDPIPDERALADALIFAAKRRKETAHNWALCHDAVREEALEVAAENLRQLLALAVTFADSQ